MLHLRASDAAGMVAGRPRSDTSLAVQLLQVLPLFKPSVLHEAVTQCGGSLIVISLSLQSSMMCCMNMCICVIHADPRLVVFQHMFAADIADLLLLFLVMQCMRRLQPAVVVHTQPAMHLAS